jgi:hypothetical protein
MQTGAQKPYDRPTGGMCGKKDFNAFPLGKPGRGQEGRSPRRNPRSVVPFEDRLDGTQKC